MVTITGVSAFAPSQIRSDGAKTGWVDDLKDDLGRDLGNAAGVCAHPAEL